MEEKERELIKQALEAMKRLDDAKAELKRKYQSRVCAWCCKEIAPGDPFIAYNLDEIYCDWECMARHHGGFEVEYSLFDVNDERKYYLGYFWTKPEEDEQKGKEANNEVQN